MPTTLAKTMRAIVLPEFQPDVGRAIASLYVAERPLPSPSKGQVLVKVEAAPCNPSDLISLTGASIDTRSPPIVPGREGAGTVIAAGEGLLPWLFRGRRVACAVHSGDGTWAEYVVVDAAKCIPIKKKLRLQQAATLIINPFTAVGLLDTARRDGHTAAVVTAGASQLGRMLLIMARERNFPLIFTVRQQKQAEVLKSLGAKHVLDSSSSDFAEQLTSIATEVRATAAFEAIAGEMTGLVMRCLPPGARVYVYGALSEQPCGDIEPVDFIYHGKSLQGFLLPHWIQQRGLLGAIRASNYVQRLLINGKIETAIARRLALDEVAQGLQQYVNHMTSGKMLIMPQKPKANSQDSDPSSGD